MYLRAMNDWMAALRDWLFALQDKSFPSFIDFLDSCNFCI